MDKNVVIEGKYSNCRIFAFCDKIWIDVPPIGANIDINTISSYRMIRYNSAYYYIQVFWKYEDTSIIKIECDYYNIFKKAVSKI